MIAVKLNGRLGNQFFQYAFIYSAAKKLNTGFYLLTTVEPFLLEKYFEIGNDICGLLDKYVFSITGFKNIFTYHSKHKFYNTLQTVFRLKTIIFDNEIDPSTQIKLISNNAIYEGYFQSEEYFKDFQQQIRKLFTVKKAYIKAFQKIITDSAIPPHYVVIHIRRGDYIKYDLALPYEYFHRAIRSIHHEENFYVFISDDPDIIDHEFSYIKSKYISKNIDIIDFQFLKNAATCILSNSSFSWWGAYLNDKDPYVIAPEYWLGFKEKTEIPVNIIPDKFIAMGFLNPGVH